MDASFKHRKVRLRVRHGDFANVVHRPGEKASMTLANIVKSNKRFIFWDEYRPVEFAAWYRASWNFPLFVQRWTHGDYGLSEFQ